MRPDELTHDALRQRRRRCGYVRRDSKPVLKTQASALYALDRKRGDEFQGELPAVAGEPKRLDELRPAVASILEVATERG